MMGQMAPFLSLHRIVADMLDAAQREAWDDFIELQAKHQALSASLPPIDWHGYSHDEQAQLVVCLRETRDMLDRIVPLAEHWRGELAGMLSSIHNSNKLDKAYRT
jgi:hypothetical protein